LSYKVQDNVLSKEHLSLLQKTIIWNKQFPFYLIDEVSHGGDKSNGFYAVHLLYSTDVPVKVEYISQSSWCHIVQPILDILKPSSLIRIKANFYPRTDSLLENDPHEDYDFDHKGAIFYLNSCDGFTRMSDGTKIDSIENRLLHFNPSDPHNSSTCTNQLGRFNINFNYF